MSLCNSDADWMKDKLANHVQRYRRPTVAEDFFSSVGQLSAGGAVYSTIHSFKTDKH